MKKMTKVLLGIALACGITGGAFVIVSLCLGFQKEEFGKAVSEGRFNWSAGPNWADGAGNLMSDVLEEKVDFEETYSDIESLKLDTGTANCTFLPGDSDEWKVIGYDVPARFQCKKSGNTLKITCKRGFWSFWHIVDMEPQLEIRIPRSHQMKEVELDMGVGDVTAEEITLQCRKLKLDSGVGDCRIRADVEKSVEVDGGVGEVQLTLIGQEQDFDYDVECGVGSVSIGDTSYSDIGSDIRKDNGAGKRVEIDCGVGGVDVQFEMPDEEKSSF